MHGGTEAVYAAKNEPGAQKQRFLSELMVGGYAGWSEVQAQGGRAAVQPKVDWNGLV